jgi:hypothetical protein
MHDMAALGLNGASLAQNLHGDEGSNRGTQRRAKLASRDIVSRLLRGRSPKLRLHARFALAVPHSRFPVDLLWQSWHRPQAALLESAPILENA